MRAIELLIVYRRDFREGDKDPYCAGVYDSLLGQAGVMSLDLKLKNDPDAAVLKLARGYMKRFHPGMKILGCCRTKSKPGKLTVAFIRKKTLLQRLREWKEGPL